MAGKEPTYRITIPLVPRTKKNSQQIRWRKGGPRGSHPYIAPSEAYRAYLAEAGWFLKPLGIDYPVNVRAHYYMDTMRKVDLNNLHSALHDCLVACGVLVDDNAHYIASTDGSRVYYDKARPRTEILIEPTDPTFYKPGSGPDQ